MTPAQKYGLYANLPRVQAQRQIEEGRTEGLGHEGIYELYLTAYGDERLAQRAKIQWLEDYVRRQCNR